MDINVYHFDINICLIHLGLAHALAGQWTAISLAGCSSVLVTDCSGGSFTPREHIQFNNPVHTQASMGMWYQEGSFVLTGQ